jgi:hypothetical protein
VCHDPARDAIKSTFTGARLADAARAAARFAYS